MEYAFPPAPVVSLAIAASAARFPVRRVFCVGRNYADHAREMGAPEQADGREPPFFFSKPADALVPGAVDVVTSVAYPSLTSNLQHEVELVVALGPNLPNGGADIAITEALQAVFGYSVGIDLTRRDMQAQAKAKGHPWDMSKGFDASAPIGVITPWTSPAHPANARIWLSVNGQLRQDGNVAEMSWSVAGVIAQLSRFVRLAPGDLIYTGTPAGVGTVSLGDVMECGVEGLGSFSFRLV